MTEDEIMELNEIIRDLKMHITYTEDSDPFLDGILVRLVILYGEQVAAY